MPNSAIVRHPGRHGVLIQGDTLSSYLPLLQDAADEVGKGDRREGLKLIKEASEMLETHLGRYVETLEDRGIELPFVRSSGK